MSQRPLSGARLYSLIGDTMHDLSPRFIEKLERMLEQDGMADPGDGRVLHLSLLGHHLARQRLSAEDGDGDVVLSEAKVRGLGAILDVLDGAYLDNPRTMETPGLPPHVVEGLLAAARELLV